jgi:hypothetical protein
VVVSDVFRHRSLLLVQGVRQYEVRYRAVKIDESTCRERTFGSLRQRWAVKVKEMTGAHALMMSGRVVFAKKSARLSLPQHPAETHVNGSGATLFYGFVGDTGCADFVGLPISTSVVQMVVPSFQLKKTASYGGMDVDSTVFGWWCCVGIRRSGRVLGEVAEKIEAGRARFGFDLREIGGVAVHVEAHFAGREANDSVRMGGAIVQDWVSFWAVASVPFAWAEASVPRVTRRVESTARA